MWFDDENAREAFRLGAKRAFDSCVVQMDARQERAVFEWIRELDHWSQGEPPEAPADW